MADDIDELESLAPQDDTQDDDQKYGLQPEPLPSTAAPFVPPPPQDEHIPLEDAVMLASPQEGPQGATIGMVPPPPMPLPMQPMGNLQGMQASPAETLQALSPAAYTPPPAPPTQQPYAVAASNTPPPPVQNMPSPAGAVQPYQYLLSRGTDLNAQFLNPTFANRLTQAIQAAESATGSKASLSDLYRPAEIQAQYYADYTRHPVTFGGTTYQPNPNNTGGLAAPPGRSLHEQGLAADIRKGPVLDYLHQNAGRYGLEFLKGSAFQRDPVHIQMAGGRSGAAGPSGSIPGPGAGAAGAPGPYGGATAPASANNLMQLRQAQFSQELADPNTRRLFAASVNAEVGGQGPRAEQAYIESVMNRAASRGMTLNQALTSAHSQIDPVTGQRGYYPDTTIRKLGEGFGPDQQGRINGYIQNALRGSNVSNFATGNESGSVHSGGAPVAFDPRTGERFVQENADAKWVASMMGGKAAPIRYAARDTGTMTDASPELPYQVASVNIAGAPDEPIQQPEEAGPPQEDQDVAAMREYLDQLKRPMQPQAPVSPLPPVPPVDLQPATTPSDADLLPWWMASAMLPTDMPSLTHTVIGADGQPQNVQAFDAALDPTIGMTKGIAQSPEFLQRFANGEIKPLSHMSGENQKSMTHVQDHLSDNTGTQIAKALALGEVPPEGAASTGARVGMAIAGLPSRMAQGAYETAMTPGRMAEEAYHGDISHMLGGTREQEAIDWANEAAQATIGATTPFRTPTGLGSAGGKIIMPELPRDTSGQFVERPGMPVHPKDPATGKFVRLEPTFEKPTAAAPPPAAEAPVAPPLATKGLSPVGELLALRETQPPVQAAAPTKLPPAPQIPPPPAAPPVPPPNARAFATNPRALGMNPRAVAARRAAEVQAADVTQRTEPPVLPQPAPGTQRQAPPIIRPPAGPAAVSIPAPAATRAIPVDVVPANQVPNLPPMPGTPQPSLTQTPPVAPPPSVPPPSIPPPSVPAIPTAAPASLTWKANFTPKDYSLLANDRIGPIDSYAAKTGLTPQVLDELHDMLREYTGSQSQSLANAAVEEGRAISPHFEFKVPVSLRKIEAYANFRKNKGFREYLNDYSDLDEVRNIQRKRTAATNANPQVGPPMVHGKTEADILQSLNSAEQAHPDWARVRGHYRENILESRRGQAEGEHSIMTKSEELNKHAYNPNEVPVSRSRRAEYLKYPNGRNAMGEPIRRPDPIKAAIEYVTAKARQTINEQATGKVIDTIRQSPGGQHMFKFVKPGDISQSLQNRHIRMYRRGVRQHVIADNPTMKDLLRFGPDHFSMGTVSKVLGFPRRVFVASTTGLLQPYFAVRDTLRNYRIAKLNSAGMRYAKRPPGLARTGYAIGSSSLARLAKHASYSLDATSGGWLRHAFGDNASNHIANILANQYARSTVANIRARGTHSIGLMRYGADSALVNPHSRLRAMVQDMSTRPGTRQLATLGHAYRNFLNDVHQSLQTASVQKNFRRVYKQTQKELGPSATHEEITDATYNKLVPDANALVGDPLVSGTARNQEGHFIRYQTKDPMSAGLAARAKVAEAWVGTHDTLRELSPWHNMSMQGLKAFPRSAKRSRAKFALKALTSVIAPPVLTYMWNSAAGVDPEGTPYIRHQLYGRNEYRRGMSLYIAWPGRRAAEGIEMPWPQEFVFPKMGMEAIMSHIYGDNYWSDDHGPNAPHWSKSQDAKAALATALDVVLPPIHPLFGAGMEALGASAPGNVGAFFRSPLGNTLGQNVGASDIGGDTFMRKQNQFDTNKVMSQLNESLSRAVSPAILDMWLAGLGAYEHSDETGYANALGNSLKQMGKLQLQRTDLLNNAFNTFAPPAGNTRMVNEMYNRDQAIKGLLQYYHQWGMTGEQFVTKAKPTSPSGEAMATRLLGPQIPPHSPGLDQVPATNPLYKEFAALLDARFNKDSLDRGGMGFKSLWDRYSSDSKAIQSMRYIDFGNLPTWKRRIEERPDVMQALKNAGIDHTDPFAVRSWYERHRQAAAREINAAITRVEDEMTARHPEYGRRITIQDITPHGVPDFGTPPGEEQ
jgi:hypothetical protein